MTERPRVFEGSGSITPLGVKAFIPLGLLFGYLAVAIESQPGTVPWLKWLILLVIAVPCTLMFSARLVQELKASL
jgi:hypothetical protein